MGERLTLLKEDDVVAEGKVLTIDKTKLSNAIDIASKLIDENSKFISDLTTEVAYKQAKRERTELRGYSKDIDSFRKDIVKNATSGLVTSLKSIKSLFDDAASTHDKAIEKYDALVEEAKNKILGELKPVPATENKTIVLTISSNNQSVIDVIKAFAISKGASIVSEAKQ